MTPLGLAAIDPEVRMVVRYDADGHVVSVGRARGRLGLISTGR